MTYGEKIASIRESSNLSIRKFAKLVGCSYTYIPQLEKGISTSNKPLSPTIEILMQICEKTGYDFALFLAETGYLNPERVCMNDDEVENLKEFRHKFSTENMENILEMEQILNITNKNEEFNLKK